jgi:hypothetical protein
MKFGAAAPFGAQLKALREAAGFTQEEPCTPRRGSVGPGVCGRAHRLHRCIAEDIDDASMQMHRLRTTLATGSSKMREP